MTDGERLLAAVIDAPDDDLPRLAYADWLEERGDAAGRARASFIRLQIELARLAEDDPRRPVELEHVRERLPVGHVRADEREPRVGGELRQARLFERRVVVVVQVVQAEDGMTILEETPGDVKADESGGACDKDGS